MQWEGQYIVVSKQAGEVTDLIRFTVSDKFLLMDLDRLKLSCWATWAAICAACQDISIGDIRSAAATTTKKLTASIK